MTSSTGFSGGTVGQGDNLLGGRQVDGPPPCGSAQQVHHPQACAALPKEAPARNDLAPRRVRPLSCWITFSGSGPVGSSTHQGCCAACSAGRMAGSWCDPIPTSPGRGIGCRGWVQRYATRREAKPSAIVSSIQPPGPPTSSGSPSPASGGFQTPAGEPRKTCGPGPRPVRARWSPHPFLCTSPASEPPPAPPPRCSIGV
jgi:hypothetical protein